MLAKGRALPFLMTPADAPASRVAVARPLAAALAPLPALPPLRPLPYCTHYKGQARSGPRQRCPFRGAAKIVPKFCYQISGQTFSVARGECTIILLAFRVLYGFPLHARFFKTIPDLPPKSTFRNEYSSTRRRERETERGRESWPRPGQLSRSCGAPRQVEAALLPALLRDDKALRQARAHAEDATRLPPNPAPVKTQYCYPEPCACENPVLLPTLRMNPQVQTFRGARP